MDTEKWTVVVIMVELEKLERAGGICIKQLMKMIVKMMEFDNEVLNLMEMKCSSSYAPPTQSEEHRGGGICKCSKSARDTKMSEINGV